MSKKWELLDARFDRAMQRAIFLRGELSLITIVSSQYYFPRNDKFKPRVVSRVLKKKVINQ